jgi:hypothetical protein
MVEATHYFDHYDGQHEEQVKVLRCNAKKTYLVPPKAEHRGNYYEFGDEENDSMPLSCDKFAKDSLDTLIDKYTNPLRKEL